MSHLLDVNLLIACGWASHVEHALASRWLARQTSFATCAISQMGFLRVSLSPAFGATFEDALCALEDIVTAPRHRLVADSIRGRDLPIVSGTKEITDAHLVRLAAAHRLKLATLDKPLCGKAWAHGIAELVR